MKKTLATLVSLIVVTIIFGTIYISEEQSQRLAANDPQIQIVEDSAAALNTGAIPADIANGKIKMDSSLSPFLIIYDKAGKVVSGNGYLNDKVPVVPIGVLTNSKEKTYNYVTWQPQSGVRIAAVAVTANNYYVLSGRSLTEVEVREQKMLTFSIMGWICSVVVILGTYAFSTLLSKNKSSKRTRKSN
jgi:hypothetical protein